MGNNKKLQNCCKMFRDIEMKIWNDGDCVNLHNWMEELYQSLGGKEEFNMKIIQVLPEDIDRLEEDTKSGKIKEYDKLGYFWGDRPFEYCEYSSIMNFCEKAREEFKNGNAVFYESWY